MHEAQRLWSEATAEEAPEVKLLESLFTHMTYRLDSTETIAVCRCWLDHAGLHHSCWWSCE